MFDDSIVCDPISLVSASIQKRVRRGLMDLDVLNEIATTYLSIQHKLWPNISKNILPPVSKTNVQKMVDEFIHTYTTGNIIEFKVNMKDPLWEAVAAAYLRYSDPNSNARASFLRQIRPILESAKQRNHFIPWTYIFADAAITATIAARNAYNITKSAVSSKDTRVEVLYIHDMGRASRDMIETLTLGRFIQTNGKRLIGVSDGFDTENPMWKMQMAMLGSLNEWFIDQLRDKVKGGLLEAFLKGTCIGSPAFGYKLVPAIDNEGRFIHGKDGEQCNMLAIDEEQSKYVVEAFELFAVKKKSRDWIARYFNENQVGNKSTWDPSRITQLLKRRKYIGIDIYRATRQVRDSVTGSVKTLYEPRENWNVKRVPHLKIVSRKLWKQAKARFAEIRKAYDNKGKDGRDPFECRTQVYPTTLIRPVCQYCKQPLWMGRSGKYSAMHCRNGHGSKHDCKLKGYKTVSIMENIILDRLFSAVLNEENVTQLVTAANKYLAEAAAKPKADNTLLVKEMASLRKKIDRLALIIEDQDPKSQGLPTLVANSKTYELRLKELSAQVRATDTKTTIPPVIDITTVLASLADFRNLLKLDVAQAARAIEALTGPIYISEETRAGVKKPVWMAKFAINFAKFNLELAKNKNCPTARTWEFLNTGTWTNQEKVEWDIRKIPQYEVLAPQVRKMHDSQVSLHTISSALQITRSLAQKSLVFALTGECPNWKASKKTRTEVKNDKIYETIAPEVAKLRKKELSFPEIGKRLGVSVGTVTRAYDFNYRDVVYEGALVGKNPDRGYCGDKISPKIRKKIRQLIIESKMKCYAIAKHVQVGVSTVYRERDKLKSQPQN